MADSTVKPSGGDFTSVGTALSDSGTGNGDTITVSGDWTSTTDATAAVVADNDITVVVTLGDDARHKGVKVTTNHEITHTSTSDAITINSGVTGCVLDGLIIKQGGTTDDAKGVQIDGAVTVKNCIVWTAAATDGQDGIYGSTQVAISIQNTFVSGFAKGGIRSANIDGFVWDINSCGIYKCGQLDHGAAASGITGGDVNNTWNVQNTWSMDNGAFGGKDYKLENPTWNISNCIDSDNSIATVLDTGGSNFASRTLNESTQGGNEVIVVDKTTAPYDLRLVDDATNNDAQDAHTDDEAHGLTILAEDIANTSRPQNTSHDIGPFEVVAAAGLSPAEIITLLNRDKINPIRLM